ncbi:hypothetical protein [Saccharopolyspora griseoalba]|uniref:Uncharacterized protein n=1 Tax=Saccharopolyspora griseoalba TaxID=1431848 RepID=A0ABW2LL98_9PSEU
MAGLALLVLALVAVAAVFVALRDEGAEEIAVTDEDVELPRETPRAGR